METNENDIEVEEGKKLNLKFSKATDYNTRDIEKPRPEELEELMNLVETKKKLLEELMSLSK